MFHIYHFSLHFSFITAGLLILQAIPNYSSYCRFHFGICENKINSRENKINSQARRKTNCFYYLLKLIKCGYATFPDHN